MLKQDSNKGRESILTQRRCHWNYFYIAWARYFCKIFSRSITAIPDSKKPKRIRFIRHWQPLIYCITQMKHLALRSPKSDFFFFFLDAPGAYGILVPWPEIEPGPRQWKCQVLTTGPPGNCPKTFIYLLIFTAARRCNSWEHDQTKIKF